MIQYRSIKLNELEEYIQSSDYLNSDIHPISKHRANSYITNPRSKKENTVLILAKQNGKLLGYIGILPDYIKKIEPIYFGWFSCLWLGENSRGLGIANELIKKAIEAYNSNIILTEFVPSLYDKYKKIGLFDFEYTLIGTRIYIKSTLRFILTKKHPNLTLLKPFLGFLDLFINLGMQAVNFISLRNTKETIYSELTSFDDESIEFINKFNQNKIFNRSITELNWIIKYPWILSPKSLYPESNKYYFSSIADKFEYKIVKVNNFEKRIVGVLFFTNRDGHLKLQYAYYNHSDIHNVMEAILSYCFNKDFHTCSIYDKHISALLQKNSGIILKKKIYRKYLISNELKNQFEDNSIIEAGDGDCVFT